jgi:hypothetical protein
MDKLYDHVLQKQTKELETLRQEVEFLKRHVTSTPTGRALPEKIESKSINTAQVKAGRDAKVDQSTGKTIKNTININIFGSEKTDHIKPTNVLDLVKKLGPLGEDLGKSANRLLLSMAMMIFSDEKHPENITCYLPNKKSKEALVHDESGWTVLPISLTLSPMASRSVDELFRKQPWPGQDGIEADAKLDVPTQVLGYIKKHEGDLVGNASMPGSELRAIPIRNKEILEKVLAKLPKTGDD